MTKTMSFAAPSHTASIEIWQHRVENSWGAEADLVTSQGRTTLVEGNRETFLSFVHVYWSPDENKVGILATGFVHWEAAFDRRANRQIPFQQIRDEMAASIRRSYDVPNGEDPVDWAGMSQASFQFFKRHPEIQVSYHR